MIAGKSPNKPAEDFQILAARELPDFMSQIALLLMAGIPLTAAWERSLNANSSGSDLEMELRQVIRDMRQGMAFVSALEALARRRPCQEIQMFVMLLSQNAKKGRGELAKVLNSRAKQGWEMRKQQVRRQGEAAFIKMLFPMVLMLIAILLIVTAPAMMTLS
ncbi:MAG: type II secretion system F family protein [Peptococcaceae bacterium]|jgi:tight adherence protein C|nr:type II secretion system F family protein [Peptococcaceae bacterium]